MSDQSDNTPESVADSCASDEVLLGFVIKAELLALLDDVDIHSLGSFATSGSVPHAVNPGLTINGLGGIGLPLSTRDALELSTIAHQAAFGKGTETIVDTSIRRTWELDPSQFVLQNPSWQRCVHDLTAHVASELGILSGDKAVRAELYKLLLYEEGAFFERHKDSEKAEGMFGTLVVALPSSHRGGDVLTTFGDRKQTLSTSSSSDFGFSYLAWYADVEHAVLPITSGYRLVLMYNLVSHGKPQTAASLEDDHAKLCKLLASWTRSNESSTVAIDAPGTLAYLLDHEYTEAGLRLDRLKGQDRRKVEYLKRASDEQDFCIFLAQLELSREGGCDEPEDGYGYGYGSSYKGGYHEHFDVYETKVHLRKVFEVDGRKIATNVDLDVLDIVQEDAFDNKDPDDEDFSGYTGNEGVTSTHFYHRTCVVIVPRSKKIDFLFESQIKRKTDVADWANSMLQKLSKPPEDVDVRVDLEAFCELIIRNVHTRGEEPMGATYYPWEPPRPVPDTSISSCALVALRLRRPDLLDRLAQVTHAMLSPAVYEELGKSCAQDDSVEWQTSLEKAFLPITKIRKHHDALDYVRKGFETVEPQREGISIGTVVTEIWEALLSKLDSITKVDTDDVEPLLEMASRLGEGASLAPIASFVEKHISQVDFVVSLLYYLKDNKTIDERSRQQMHYDIHSKLAATFSIHSAFSLDKSTSTEDPTQWKYRYGHSHYAEQSEKTHKIHDRVERFATFLAQSFS